MLPLTYNTAPHLKEEYEPSCPDILESGRHAGVTANCPQFFSVRGSQRPEFPCRPDVLPMATMMSISVEQPNDITQGLECNN